MCEHIAGRLYPFRLARRRWRTAGRCLSEINKQRLCQVMAFTPDDNLAPSRFSSGNRLKDAGLAVLSALSALPPSMGKPLLPFTRFSQKAAEEPPPRTITRQKMPFYCATTPLVLPAINRPRRAWRGQFPPSVYSGSSPAFATAARLALRSFADGGSANSWLYQ